MSQPTYFSSLFGIAGKHFLLCAIMSISLFSGGILQGQKQEFTISPVMKANGAPYHPTSSILRDSRGLVWFGTWNGLERFDGYDIKPYRLRKINGKSYPKTTVTCLVEDTMGMIWIGTYETGLIRFDPVTEQMEVFSFDKNNKETIPNNFVTSLALGKDQKLWIGTSEGMAWLDLKSSEITRLEHIVDKKGSIHTKVIRRIFVDSKGTLWVGTSTEGLYRMIDFNEGNPIFFNYRLSNEIATFIPSEYVSSFTEDFQNQLYIGTNHGLVVIDLNRNYKAPGIKIYTDTTETEKLINPKIEWLTTDTKGRVWVGMFNGIQVFLEKGKKLTEIRQDPKDHNAFKMGSVDVLYADKQENVWVGHHESVAIISPKKRKINNFYSAPENSESPVKGRIYAYLKDSYGNEWIGTNKAGLVLKDATTGNSTVFSSSENNQSGWVSNDVLDILEDKNGKLWFGTSKGLAGFDLKAWEASRKSGQNQPIKFEIFNKDSQGQPDKTPPHHLVYRLAEDNTGKLWLATYFGLSKFDLKKKTFQNYIDSTSYGLGRVANYFYSVLVDFEGNIWFGGQNGVTIIPKGTKEYNRTTLRYQEHDFNNPFTISNNNVFDITQDNYGNIWLATGEGICKFDSFSSKADTLMYFTRFVEKFGLEETTVYGIQTDSRNWVWAGTENGLLAFNPLTGYSKLYRQDDGLIGNTVNLGMVNIQNDELTAAFYNGYSQFRVTDLKIDSTPINVVLTGFRIFNQEVPVGNADSSSNILDGFYLEKEIASTKHLNLSYRHYVLTFDFAGLNYQRPEIIQYAYKMEGFDQDWTLCGPNRSVTYTNLDPGKYTLRIKATNQDGIWNEEGISLPIIISPPWWQTTWAYLLFAGIGLGLVGGFFLIKEKRHRKRIALQQVELDREKAVTTKLREVDKMKDDFLANTSHELRTPLHGIIGLAESMIAGNQKISNDAKQNLRMIASSGKRLSYLVNDLLDFSKLKSHDIQLQLKPIDMHSMADVVIKLCQPLVKDKNLRISNDISKKLKPVFADENRIQQVLMNLMGNAIKFTAEGSINLTANEEGGMVHISVEDTGIGIPEDKLEKIFASFVQAEDSIARNFGGTGLGLTISKQLVELHGGHIKVASHQGKGSIFTFSLPVSDEIPATMDEQINSGIIGEQLEIQIGTNEEAEVISNKVESQFNILVVDDEPVNVQVLVNYLSINNYKVIQAYNGTQALNYLENGNQFHLVLLDIMMPGMSGFEVLSKLRENYSLSDLPVIILTARNQLSDMLEGFDSGANDYLTKPFSQNELMARITTQLNLVKSNEDLKEAQIKMAQEEMRTIKEMAMRKEAELRAIAAEAEARVKIEQVKLEEREIMRKKSAQDFHDEAGNKLTRISLLTEIAKSKSQDEEILSFLEKVELETKDLASGMRDFIWVLDPAKDALSDTLMRLRDFGNALFDLTEIEFESSGFDIILNQINLAFEEKRHILLIFKEAMNNTLKYAGAKKVTLNVEVNEREMCITLVDDGIGFDIQSISTGYGLENMRSRAKKINADILIDSRIGNGTKICLQMNIAHMGN